MGVLELIPLFPPPLTVKLWDEELWQDCPGWLCFPKLCSEVLAGIGLWQSCGKLLPFSAQFPELANKLHGLKDESGK